MAYTKLDAGITDSTIWQAADGTRLVWITMLAMADQNGYVGASMPGLAGRARVSLQACIEAIATLEAPDQWSRTKDNEGRRIAAADGGWVLLNHKKYRALQTADDRRERSRVAMARLRERRKKDATVNTGEQSCSELTQAEAEAEVIPSSPSVQKEARKRATPHPKPLDVSEAVWDDWTAHRKRKRADVSATTIDGARVEAEKAGLTLEAFLKVWVLRGSQGLLAEWLKPDEKTHRNGSSAEPAWRQEQRERMRKFAGPAAAKSTTEPETIDVPSRILG